MTRKLKAMPYAQAWVGEGDNGMKVLRSYETIVAVVNPEGWLEIFGLYSATTRKHISAFMRELGLTYQMAKAIYENKEEMNIYTGEVRAL